MAKYYLASYIYDDDGEMVGGRAARAFNPEDQTEDTFSVLLEGVSRELYEDVVLDIKYGNEED